MGYEEDESDMSQPSDDSSSAVKKQKYCVPTDEDWNYLATSKHGKNITNLNRTLKLTNSITVAKIENILKKKINTKNILFPYIRVIHLTLHLVYEDLKLNTLHSPELLPLMKFLYRLSTDMGLNEYNVHYWHDFPDQVSPNVQLPSISKSDMKSVISPAALMETPISIMKYIHELLNGVNHHPYPYLCNVNTRSRDIVQVMF